MKRMLALVLTFALVGAACGRSGDELSGAETIGSPSQTTVKEQEAQATTPSPEATTSIPATTSPLIAPSNAVDTAASGTFGALDELPTIPIANEWLFDQGFWNPIGLGEQQVIMAIQGGLRVLNLETDEYRDINLVREDDRRLEAFLLFAHGDRYASMVADERGNGTLDHFIAIDTLEERETGREPGLSYASGGNPERVLRGITEWDITTMTEGIQTEVQSEPWVFPYWTEDEFWSLTSDGGLHLADATTYEPLAEYDLGMSLQVFATVTAVSPTTVLVGAGQTTWLLVDRESGDVLQVDIEAFLDQFPEGTSFFGDGGVPDWSYGADEDFYMRAQIGTPESSRWTLVTIDQKTGEITSLHVIADASFDHGWNEFERPSAFAVGDRMFIADHLRRIVEVDLDQLGKVSEPWVDHGHSYLPVLTPEERAVDEVTQRLLAGDTDAIDDRALAEGLLATVLDFVADDDWFSTDVAIAGDRAWSRVRGVGQIGLPFTYRRVDGEWLLDAEGMCITLEAQRGADLSCEPS